MTNKKPTDNSILVKLVGKTRKNELEWYIIKDTDVITIYQTTYKITSRKYISYKIFHIKNNPSKTTMSVYFEFRNYKYFRDDLGIIAKEIQDVDMKRIRTIKEDGKILLLLNTVLENMGYDVIKSVVSIIINKKYKNGKFVEKILIVKRHEYDDTIPNVWVLPGGKINKTEEIHSAMRREVEEETGLIPIRYKLLDYKNLIQLNDKYYFIRAYLVIDYNGELLEYPTDEIADARWVNKEDLFNYYIGDETKKIISFYTKHN